MPRTWSCLGFIWRPVGIFILNPINKKTRPNYRDCLQKLYIKSQDNIYEEMPNPNEEPINIIQIPNQDMNDTSVLYA